MEKNQIIHIVKLPIKSANQNLTILPWKPCA